MITTGSVKVYCPVCEADVELRRKNFEHIYHEVLCFLVTLTAGIGFFVSIFNAVIRDIGSILGLIMSLGMFATPVVYPPPTTWPLSFWINYANPVSGFLVAGRDLATVGYMTDPINYFSASLFGLMLFFVGWRIFHLSEPKIAERV